jgi:hypothetical protein
MSALGNADLPLMAFLLRPFLLAADCSLTTCARADGRGHQLPVLNPKRTGQ